MTRIFTLILLLIFSFGCADKLLVEPDPNTKKPVKRVGMLIGIKAEMIEQYKSLHADSHEGVRDLLGKYHIQNFSIYLQKIGDKWYEFGYYEYSGDDFEADMAQLNSEPRNIAWLEMCDPMQVPLPGADGWQEMERIYFNP